jgi:hypothetical protein
MDRVLMLAGDGELADRVRDLESDRPGNARHLATAAMDMALARLRDHHERPGCELALAVDALATARDVIELVRSRVERLLADEGAQGEARLAARLAVKVRTR